MKCDPCAWWMYELFLTTAFGTVCLAGKQASTAPAVGGSVAQSSINVRAYGAAGDGRSKDTRAVQRAIDAAEQGGGGRVTFPPGKYLCGTLMLKSGVTLHLESGVTLLGSTDLADYPRMVPAFRSYTDNYATQSLLYGEGLHDVAITGFGIIDGQGGAFKTRGYDKRPFILRLVSCRNIVVEGVTMRNSAMWMQHYLACDNVTIRGITVYNHCNYNNDMIDIDCCRDVRISDCRGDTDDDALTLKSTADRPCENITVTNCVLSSNCNAIKMGTETNGGFKNVTISNCVIAPTRSEKVFHGTPGGLSGVALEIVDGGTLDRVTISNITMSGMKSPIFLRLGNRARPFRKDMPKPGVGTFRNVIISNVIATDVSNVGCAIVGLPGHPIENVILSNIRITAAGGGKKDHISRPIPEEPAKYPECTMFGTLPAYGFFCRHVNGLTLDNVEVRTVTPDARPALVCDDVRNLTGSVNGQGK